MRIQSQEFNPSGIKHSLSLNGRWLSPSHDIYHPHDGSNPADDEEDEGDMDTRHPRLFMDHETGSSVINYNGESYHMLLVPTGLPGGLETLAGVRFGLLRTWLYAQSVMKHSSPSSGGRSTGNGNGNNHTSTNPAGNNNSNNTIVLKPELLSEKTVTDSENANDPNQTYNNSGRAMEPDTVLHQLLAIESQLARAIRERIFPSGACPGPYTYSGESTDSQPNSNGAVVGLSLGSVDETGHPGHEFSTATNVGPLSSDSGVSSDAIQHHAPLLMNGNFPSVSLAHHRTGLYQGSVTQTATVYDTDYGNRFPNPPISQLYPSHLMNNTHLRNSIGLSGYFPEITETYPVLQPISHSQATSPTSDPAVVSSGPNSITVDHVDSLKVTTTTTSSAQARGARAETNPLPTSLSAFTSTAFYSPSYFGNRTNGNSDQVTNPTSLLDPFSRGHLSAGGGGGVSTVTNGVSAGLCFYPTAMGTTTLSESLLIPEEVISTYLDREKGYDEADGTHHPALLSRNQDRHSPSYGSSSPQSPGSSSCDQMILLEV
ncbi:unnamed protein product [Echinostoma caproni]|uniref:PUM-HD domain-containing protein n=1 Tax=Echinostoma caproni TaxID=27848 RepID=A0A183ASV9_9TREM|nr:unnamed protein product [Echinostoma caproni]